MSISRTTSVGATAKIRFRAPAMFQTRSWSIATTVTRAAEPAAPASTTCGGRALGETFRAFDFRAGETGAAASSGGDPSSTTRKWVLARRLSSKVFQYSTFSARAFASR